MVGPIMDADGLAVTDGVVGDLKISKNGGAPAALNGSATLTHRHTGHYSLALTTSDLDTVGQAEIVIDDTANAMPTKVITGIEEAVYDALFVAAAAGYSTFAGGAVASVTGAVGSVTGLTVSDVGAIKAKTDNLPTDPADQSLIIAATNAIAAAIAALNNLSAAQVASELATYDGPTHAELTTALGTADDAVLAAIAALNNLSAAQVASALNTYDAPTKAEFDAAVALLATAANLALVPAAVLTAADANPIASNVQEINDTVLEGDGGLTTPWGPA
jgi:hypothetical protein